MVNYIICCISDFGVTEESIMGMCEEVLGAGTALKVRIATDRDTGRSKGFAHVDFASPDLASRAVAELNGKKYPHSFFETFVAVIDQKSK
jgi:RNA recognition motif-containing protein